MQGSLVLLAPLAAAAVTALGAYWVAVRKLSGTIATSTAEDLWEESRAIRQDYQNRIRELVEQVKRCQVRMDVLAEENATLAIENTRLKIRVEEFELTVSSLRVEIHRLTEDNMELRMENGKLKKRVGELENHEK